MSKAFQNHKNKTSFLTFRAAGLKAMKPEEAAGLLSSAFIQPQVEVLNSILKTVMLTKLQTAGLF